MSETVIASVFAQNESSAPLGRGPAPPGARAGTARAPGPREAVAARAAVFGSAASAVQSTEAAGGQVTAEVTGVTAATSGWAAAGSRGASDGGRGLVARGDRSREEDYNSSGRAAHEASRKGTLYSGRKSAGLAKRRWGGAQDVATV